MKDRQHLKRILLGKKINATEKQKNNFKRKKNKLMIF